MSLLNTVLERANAFTRSFVRENGTLWRWATVTSVNPVKIRYDGASDPALITPTVLGVPVGVGDRVRTATVRGQTIIWKTGSGGTPYATAAGAVEVTGDGTNSASAVVPFPAGRFSVTPLVPALTPNIINYNATWQALTSTGFTVTIRRMDYADFTTTVAVHWQAVQMTPTSAEG